MTACPARVETPLFGMKRKTLSRFDFEFGYKGMFTVTSGPDILSYNIWFRTFIVLNCDRVSLCRQMRLEVIVVCEQFAPKTITFYKFQASPL